MALVQDSSTWDFKKVQIVELPNSQKVLDVDGIFGFLIPAELKFIYDLASTLPKGGKYLEIGSFMGLSATIFASRLVHEGNFDAKVFCVDTWSGSVEHQELDFVKNDRLFQVFKANIARAKVAPFITACRGKSTEVVSLFEDNSLDIIFIDGDHTYDGCLADMKAWFPKLKRGGRFMGHDAIPVENPTCGVRRALQDFSREYGFDYTIYEPPVSNNAWEIFTSDSARSL